MKTLLLYVMVIGFNACFSPVMSESPYSRSVNDLGFQICNSLDPHGNIFLSPISIHMVLEMVYMGSAGNTKQQIQTAFNMSNLGLSENDLYEIAEYLTELYTGNNNTDYDLTLANAAFINNNFDLKENFVHDVKHIFHAIMDKISFAKGTEAQDIINKWASEKTHGMIPHFLEAPFDPSTLLALLNAVYFKGTWKTRFDPKNTFDGTFKKPNNENKQVKLMKITNSDDFLYFIDEKTNYKFLEMPYKGQDISMLIALPMDENAFPDLAMTDDILYRVTRSLRGATFSLIEIPKFILRYKTELQNVLKKMGVQDLFTENADFSPMSSTKGLSVSHVLHEAMIHVDEKGSEAAAVTAVGIQGPGAALPSPPVEFIADRPFLFYILDNRFDIVLFAGRLVDP